MTVRNSLFAALSVFALAPAAPAWNRSPAVEFATLPPGLRNPEGITVDRSTGQFYVADFDYRGSRTGNGQIAVFSQSGRLLRVLNVPGTSSALLGLDFHPTTGELLVIDFGGHKVVRVNPQTGASAPFTTIPGASGPNALAFDLPAGNVYISDSFQGIIWRTGAGGGAAVPWVTSPLLATTGVPPFGANGMAFNKAQSILFVANTGNDTIVRIPVVAGVPGTPDTFVNSINGADGLVIDDEDNLWVCANQADEIVVVDKTGKAIAKLGDFEGIAPDGSPRGLLFPASLVFFGEFVYVTNLALDLRDFNPQFNAVDSQWAAEVTTYNVARISRHLPPLRDQKH
ncbi:MAG TPA: NHL repeat-containing protein [Myxococcales bacterium]|jgi:sugar lactone lactonase YvrE|nr:NHL repeat-containing protein [Myxococcales bacterium]